MQLPRTAPLFTLAATLFVAPTLADQLIPVSQTRSVSGSASAENYDYTTVSESESFVAPDFGPFVEAAAGDVTSDLADGTGGSSQSSTIGTSRISGQGSAFATAFGWGSFGFADGNGNSRFEVVFDVPVASNFTLTGFLMATDAGFSDFQLEGNGTFYVDEYAFGPSETWSLDNTGTLPAGQYTMRAGASGSAYGDAYYTSYAFGEFDFEFTLDPMVNRYCTGAVNGAGTAGSIDAAGSVSVDDNDFTLTANGLPPSVSTLFYYGPSQVVQPFGNGFRCVGGQTQRLFPVQTSDALGAVSLLLDFTALPTGAGGPNAITPNSTWNFQNWYRDHAPITGAGFNLSDAIEVTFCP